MVNTAAYKVRHEAINLALSLALPRATYIYYDRAARAHPLTPNAPSSRSRDSCCRRDRKMPTWFYLTDAEPIEQQLKNAKRSALVVCLSPEIRAQRLQKLLDSLSRKIREISGATLDAEFGDLVDSSADTSSSMSISSELRSSSPREIRGKDDSSTATNTSTSSSPSTPLTPTKVEYAAGSNDSPRPQSDGATATSAPSPSSSSPSAAAPSTVSSTSSLESALDSGANVVVAAAAAVVAPSASPSVLVKTPSIPLDRISQRPSSDATLSQLKDLMFSLRTQLSVPIHTFTHTAHEHAFALSHA